MIFPLVIQIFVAAAICHCQAATYSHQEAAAILAEHGIALNKRCWDRNNKACTSLQGIQQKAIRDVITLQRASGCRIVVTGGTETGHKSRGKYSHWGGYKLDIRKRNSCIDSYIKRKFGYVGDNYYCAASGNTYLDEGNHYDINYGFSGKC